MTVADMKYAIRLLLKTPSFTMLTVLVLSGGLGISLFTYAALDSMIYGEMPLPESRSIVRVGTGDFPNFEPLDAFEVAELRAQAKTVSEVGVFRSTRSLVGEPGAVRNFRSIEANWQIFEFSRTPPLLGRGFVPEDGAGTSEPVAVLSYEVWQSAFSGDENVIGETVRINDRLTRIVGVMPADYAFPNNAELWLPIDTELLDPSAYTGSMLNVYARIRPAVSVDAAETELTGILHRFRESHPDGAGESVAAVSVQSFQEVSWGVLGTVIFGVLNLLAIAILLLAGVNVGNLLLARTNERIKEIGVRIALGAPRIRLIAQMMLENVLLCALGGAIAIFMADRALAATDRFMNALLGNDLPFWWTWELNGKVLAVAGIFLLLTIIVVSVLPAVCVSKADPNSLLRDGTRAGGGLNMGRVSRALVTLQVALISAVLIVGSAVSVISTRAANFDFGIDTANLLMMNFESPDAGYGSDAERLRLFEQVLTELRSAPGIDAAIVMRQIDVARFNVEQADFAAPEDYPRAWLHILSETSTPIGPTLLQGRLFDGRDDASGLQVAVVSNSLARAYWPGESAVGQSVEVAIGDSAPEQRIVVGVVSDINYDPLGFSSAGDASIYLPLPQLVGTGIGFLIRHSGNEALARGAIYETLTRVSPEAMPGRINTFDYVLEQMTLFARTMTKLFAWCGAFAILLAITGIYGLSSNAVILRRHEIGLRRALGASNGNVVGIFVAQGIRQLAIGLGASVLLSTLVLLAISQGFSIEPAALVMIGIAVLSVVSACVLLSTYVSVRGVLRIEPADSLRHA